jgi:hypothetical protein
MVVKIVYFLFLYFINLIINFYKIKIDILNHHVSETLDLQ